MDPKSRKALLIFAGLSFALFAFALLFPGELPNKSMSEAQAKAAPEEVNIAELISQKSKSDKQLLNQFNFQEAFAKTVKLPKTLREISGLAITPDGKLLAHDDEKGIIHELDYTTGKIINSFNITIGGRTLREDLEGIAATEEYIYTVSSMGKIYEFSAGKNREAVPCKIYPTNLAVDWEVEGLTYHRPSRSLVIISKNPRSAKVRGKVGLFFWSLDSRSLQQNQTILMPIKDFAGKIGLKNFQPSGIEWDTPSGNYVLVAARQRAVAEINNSGNVLRVKRLTAKWHRQMEGITFLNGKGILISDEGAKQAARLTFYPLK
ncbi:MAG: hypothetical protein ACRBF0_24555 [Calditrichia bacterium]